MNQSELENKFLSLVTVHNQTIYKLCFMYATDNEDLNDLYQEVVMNLWLSFPRFRGESKESTWIYRITTNTCISFIRRSYHRPKNVSLTLAMESVFADENSNKENLKELYQLINGLGKLERALILLWLDERSYDEIAYILQISKTNVATRIARIKEKLKTMFNK